MHGNESYQTATSMTSSMQGSPRMITDVVPSPTSSSCVLLSSIMDCMADSRLIYVRHGTAQERRLASLPVQHASIYRQWEDENGGPMRMRQRMVDAAF